VNREQRPIEAVNVALIGQKPQLLASDGQFLANLDLGQSSLWLRIRGRSSRPSFVGDLRRCQAHNYPSLNNLVNLWLVVFVTKSGLQLTLRSCFPKLFTYQVGESRPPHCTL